MNTNLPMQDNQTNTITYSLEGFAIANFLLVEPGLDITREFDESKIKLGVDIDLAQDIASDSFQIILGIDYRYPISDNVHNLMEISLVTYFKINELSRFIEPTNEKLLIPNQLLVNLTEVAFSSARGIIFAKTQGSFLNSLILPLMDVKQIINSRYPSLENSTQP